MREVIYSVANPGGRLYPVSVCLQMTLAFKGEYLQLYKVENISGHPYGWFYMNDLIVNEGDGDGIEISPGTELTKSAKVASNNLGYKYEHCLTDDFGEMKDFIKRKIDEHQIIIYGPIAYKQLTYQISALRAPAVASHYVVIIGYDDKYVYFHDPNGMSYIPFSYQRLMETNTRDVMMPDSKRFSAITIEGKYDNPSEVDIFKRVISGAVESYKEKVVRKNAYVGLHAIKRYAEDLKHWLGAENRRDREMVVRKLGLYFYPKGNQMRSDAITYMQDILEYLPDLREIIESLNNSFMDACMIYNRGSEILTPKLLVFNENELLEPLKLLEQDAYRLYEIESKCLEYIHKINEFINK